MTLLLVENYLALPTIDDEEAETECNLNYAIDSAHAFPRLLRYTLNGEVKFVRFRGNDALLAARRYVG